MHLAVAFKTEGGLARCVAALDQRLQATGIEGHPVHAQQHVTGCNPAWRSSGMLAAAPRV